MIRLHTQRSANFGAKYTAITAFLFAIGVAVWVSGVATGGDWNRFGEVIITHAPVGLLGGAFAGLVIFGAIGFCVALLGIKRVGWTFTYTILGAAAFAFVTYTLMPWISEVTGAFAGAYGHSLAVGLAAIIGAVAGFLAAGALKDSLDL